MAPVAQPFRAAGVTARVGLASGCVGSHTASIGRDRLALSLTILRLARFQLSAAIIGGSGHPAPAFLDAVRSAPGPSPKPHGGRSFNGRTRGSGPRYRGSNPCLPATKFSMYFQQLAAQGDFTIELLSIRRAGSRRLMRTGVCRALNDLGLSCAASVRCGEVLASLVGGRRPARAGRRDRRVGALVAAVRTREQMHDASARGCRSRSRSPTLRQSGSLLRASRERLLHAAPPQPWRETDPSPVGTRARTDARSDARLQRAPPQRVRNEDSVARRRGLSGFDRIARP